MAVSAAHAPSASHGAVRWTEVAGVRVPVELVTLGWPDPHLNLESYEPEAELMALNMGPQHPSTHGVLRVKVWLDGERVVKAVPYLGYLHRGVEKLLETLTYVQGAPIVDKNDYVSPMTNEQAVNMAFEKLLGLEVPRRARWMRLVFAERVDEERGAAAQRAAQVERERAQPEQV